MSLSRKLNGFNSENHLVLRFCNQGVWTYIVMNLFYPQTVVRGNTPDIHKIRKEQRAESSRFGMRHWYRGRALGLARYRALGNSLTIQSLDFLTYKTEIIIPTSRAY